jgi:DNA mismatch endonuclease (patch repair protein)
MRANRAEGGRAERLLRAALWREGLRYRKHVKTLPGRPDIVFAGLRVCIFCDGDFWHGRLWAVLRQKLRRRANAAYWIPKIRRNMERDRHQVRQLTAAGWTVLRFWEGDIVSAPDEVVQHVLSALHMARDVRAMNSSM